MFDAAADVTALTEDYKLTTEHLRKAEEAAQTLKGTESEIRNVQYGVGLPGLDVFDPVTMKGLERTRLGVTLLPSSRRSTKSSDTVQSI